MEATGQDPHSRSELFTPAFIALSVAELSYFTAAGLTIPITPLFASGPLGASEAGVGLAVGAFSATALVLRPVAGKACDRIGRRPLLIGGALACAVILAAHAMAGDMRALLGLRLLFGAAEAFFFVAGFAAVADLAPPGRAGEALSFNSLSLYLGVAVGPLIGQFLLDRGGFGMAWLGGAVLALGAAVVAFRIPETGRPGTGEPTPLFHRAAVAPGLALFTGIAGMAAFFTFVAIYAADDFGLDGGKVLFTFGLIVVLTRVLFARLPDRVPPFRLGAVALGLCALGLLAAALVHTVAGLYAGAGLLAVGVAFCTPAFFAEIFARVKPSERGSASGTASLFVDLAFGVGPMMAGFVADAAGVPTAFGAAAIVAGIGAGGSLMLARNRVADRSSLHH